jgi:hypothetical protein
MAGVFGEMIFYLSHNMGVYILRRGSYVLISV